jgi:DNA-binding beta-propeller fold protein YncE
MNRVFLTMMVCLLTTTPLRADKLVLIAGGGTAQSNVPAIKAKLAHPFGIDFDRAGNFYMVELAGGRVLKVDAKGMLTILAGTGKKGSDGDGGPAQQATFNGMHSLAVAPDGTVYLADTWNQRVRKIDPRTGMITAFAGSGKKGASFVSGPALTADLGGIYCLAFNADFSKLYLTDLDQRRIRVMDMKSGALELVAGNGKKGIPADGADAKDAPLVDPRAACVDRQGNVYILERAGQALRVVDAAGKIRTVAGTGKKGLSGDGGPALSATFSGPKHLCIDRDDNVIIADSANHVVRKYTPRDGKIIRLAGTGKKGDSGNGGDPLAVPLDEPHGVHVDAAGTLTIVDSMNNRVFRLEK